MKPEKNSGLNGSLSYGKRDFAKTEGRKTEKGNVERVAEGL